MYVTEKNPSSATKIATLGPIGLSPIAPGTVGSLVTVIIWWFTLSRARGFTKWFLLPIVIILGIWASGKAEYELGEDNPSIVIDEVIGQLLVLLACPRKLGWAIFGFILFRLFDVWKPFPIGDSQKIEGGFGVVIDDVLAAIYSLIVLKIFSRKKSA